MFTANRAMHTDARKSALGDVRFLVEGQNGGHS